MPRILITGFGPFPGAPSNPTMRLARHAATLRRARLAGVERVVRLLPTTWAMLDDVPRMVAEIAPDAVLMFGLAGRRRRITPEARAQNRAAHLRLDAMGKRPDNPLLRPGARLVQRGRLDATRMVARMRLAGLPAAVSQDAGDYLCNALFWRMLESRVPCIFVHVPRPIRPTRPKHRSRGRRWRPRPDQRQLGLAAMIALDEVLRAI